MPLGRWPNEDFALIYQALSETTFVYDHDRPDRWTEATAPWVNGYWRYLWANKYLPVTAIDTVANVLTIADRPGYPIVLHPSDSPRRAIRPPLGACKLRAASTDAASGSEPLRPSAAAQGTYSRQGGVLPVAAAEVLRLVSWGNSAGYGRHSMADRSICERGEKVA